MIHVFFVAALAGLFTLALYGGLRGRLPGWAMLGLGVLPVAFVYLWSEDLRVISTHGYLHASIAYRLMEGGVVPDCPLLAHVPLLYPWAHHWVAAWISQIAGVTPAASFALLNLAALAGTLYFAYRLGWRLHGERIGATLTAALAVFGTTFFNYVVLFSPIYKATGLSAFNLRNPVVLKKFGNLNSNSLGYLFFAMALYACVEIFAEADWRKQRAAYAWLGIAVFCAGVFYPISWIGIGTCLLALSAVALARSGKQAIPTIVRAAVVAGGMSLVAAPYMWLVAAGKAQQMFLFAPDLDFLANKLLGYVLTMAPACAVLYWQRDAVRRVLDESGEVLSLLAAVPLAFFGLYVLVGTDWSTNEYKFLGMGTFSMGVVASVGMISLYRRLPIAWLIVTAAFMLGAGSDIYGKIHSRDFALTDDYRVEGSWLRHADAEEDKLYRWIVANTEQDAVLLDDRLTSPAFTRRSLYVGIERREIGKREDGWHIHPRIILDTYYGYPKELTEPRLEVVRAIYSGDKAPIARGLLDRLRSDAGGSGVFVIARDTPTQHKLDRNSDLRRVFQTRAAAIYRLNQTS